MVLARVCGGMACARLARPGTKARARPRRHLPGCLRHVRSGLLAAAVVLFGLAPPAWAAGERMALVIGNSRYERQPQVPNATADAVAVAGVLDRMGFAVERRENLGREALVDVVLAFADRSREADVALVHYAGHGAQVARDGVCENYLMPVDARLGDVREVADETVPLSRVLDEFAGRRGVLVMLLDPYRDNPLAAQMAGQGTRTATRSGLAPLPETTVSQGALLAFAAAPGKMALDWKGRDSPFATALVKNPQTPGVDIGQMLQWVALDVKGATGRKQQPEVVNWLPRRDRVYLAGPAQAAPAPLTPPSPLAPAPSVAAASAPVRPASTPTPSLPARDWSDLSLHLSGEVGLPVRAVAMSPDGAWLAETRSSDLVLRELATGRELRRFVGHTDDVTCVAFSPDGRSLATCSADETVRLWDVATGRELRRFVGVASRVFSVAFSPDGRSLAMGTNDSTAHLLDVATGHELRRFVRHVSWIYSVVFSPDGRSLATGSDDMTARLWDVTTGHELRRFVGHTRLVASVAFSPDGRSLATGSDDMTARLWDVASGRELRRFVGHASLLTSVAFSPDGRSVATGSYDMTARLWDVATGRELRRFVGHASLLTSVAFSPDGSSLATGSSDKTVRLWDVAAGRELARFIGLNTGQFLVLYGDGHSYWGSDDIDPVLSLVRGTEAIPISPEYHAQYFGPRTLDQVRQSIGVAVP